MNVVTMAWRNVWRNRRRSLVTMGAITFALVVEILYAGLMPGYIRGMEEDIVDLEVGDVQVHAEGYRTKPSIFTRIDDAEAVVRTLEQQGYKAAPRLLAGGLAASGDRSAGVALRGLDVARERGVSRLGQKMLEGQWLDASDPMGVVVGRQLARSLAVQPGSELVVLSQAADGSMANDLYRVCGVLPSVAQGTDRTAVFLTDAAFRELMVLPDGAAHQVVVRRGEVPLAQATDEVRALTPSHDVRSWAELMPVVAQMIDSSKGVVYVMFVVVYVAVGILVMNAVLMTVFERIREFGVLKAIGAGPGRVFAIILVEAAIQAGLSMVVGAVVATPGAYLLATRGLDMGRLGGTDVMGIASRTVWTGIYTPQTVVGPFVMLVVIVGLAVLYPALKAALIAPVEAMRHQ